MTTGRIDLEIFNSEYDSCRITDLDSGLTHNDFQAGEIDYFVDDDLEGKEAKTNERNSYRVITTEGGL